MSRFPPVCDVAVIGGGPAGASAALTLARAGRNTILIEASHYETPRIGENLGPAVGPLLRELGVWDEFLSLDSVPSYGSHSAWGGANLVSESLIQSPYGNGWHIDRRGFDEMLASSAARAGVCLLQGVRVAGCARMPDGRWRLALIPKSEATGDHERLHARGVIDATGRNSVLTRRSGGKRFAYDRLVGVAMFLRGKTMHSAGSTLVEAVADGWWYSAPLPDRRTIAIFMTDGDLLRPRKKKGIDVWMEKLDRTRHVSARCRGSEMDWGPGILPALSHRSRSGSGGECWLPAGDAALSVDPLSSSGVTRALRSGREVARAMTNWLDGDATDARALERSMDVEFEQYLRSRRAYYAMEARWPDSPFWRRRVSTPIPRGYPSASPGQKS